MKVLFKWLAMGAIALAVALGALACQEEKAPTTPNSQDPHPGRRRTIWMETGQDRLRRHRQGDHHRPDHRPQRLSGSCL
jgi:hypothetical protein